VRRRAIVLSILSSSAVLAAGWQVGMQTQTKVQQTDAAAQATAPGDTATTPTPTPTSGDTSTDTPTATAPPEPPAATGASGTFTGTAAWTRFGDVQVQILVADGSITDVVALQLTNHDQKSVQISNRAAPVLRQEVLTTQSANVQNVSGATYTTDGYLASLQSALDQAGL